MKLATLLYIKNQKGEYLLQKRLKNPNKDLYSPPGGKLDLPSAESPDACAVREAFEECRLVTKNEDWKLIGILTEKNFPGTGSIMIFLMKYAKLHNELPLPCAEGTHYFIHPDNFHNYELPHTDRKFIWDKVLSYDNEVFFLNLDCTYYPDVKEIKK
ncbi:MAG: hypothetical protein HGGPFJEG_02824 [Ignavibacteria bacterium]|nr:hypothetical protein [Ignavibacteria bacterium]